jgi:hypothetical protein
MARRGAWRRDPIRERVTRRTIRPQRRSGLTVRGFGLREGLKDGAFHWQRPALADSDREPTAIPPRHRDDEPTEATLGSPPGKLHDIDPLTYLRDVLPRLSTRPADQLDERLSDVRSASHHSALRETAAWAGVEVKSGPQPVLRRANSRLPHSEPARGYILGVLFRSHCRPRPGRAGSASLRRRSRSRRARMIRGRTRHEPDHPHPRVDRAGRPEGHRSRSCRQPTFPNRPRVKRPAAPPDRSKRHRPCPSIARARM